MACVVTPSPCTPRRVVTQERIMGKTAPLLLTWGLGGAGGAITAQGEPLQNPKGSITPMEGCVLDQGKKRWGVNSDNGTEARLKLWGFGPNYSCDCKVQTRA